MRNECCNSTIFHHRLNLFVTICFQEVQTFNFNVESIEGAVFSFIAVAVPASVNQWAWSAAVEGTITAQVIMTEPPPIWGQAILHGHPISNSFRLVISGSYPSQVKGPEPWSSLIVPGDQVRFRQSCAKHWDCQTQRCRFRGAVLPALLRRN